MIKNYITDPKTGIKAEVVNSDENNALVVATRPLKTFDNKLTYFSNPTYGIEMNQDGASGGTAIEIHDGIDYKRIEDGVTISAATINKFVDFMTLSNATITGSGGDLANSWVALNVQFNEAVILKSENADKMTLTINDDLSELLYLRVGVGCKVEQRE